MPGESGVTVVTTLVCFTTLCARGCGCIGHPAFPAPSVFQGRMIPAQLGRIAPRECGLLFKAVSCALSSSFETALRASSGGVPLIPHGEERGNAARLEP